jgi:hypothetical protein
METTIFRVDTLYIGRSFRPGNFRCIDANLDEIDSEIDALFIFNNPAPQGKQYYASITFTWLLYGCVGKRRRGSKVAAQWLSNRPWIV